MTPFHPDLENDAGHAIDQDDLIAFHLHELSSPQERALRRVLHTNPALQSESLAIASTLRAFPKHEPALPLDAAALDRHWQALRPSLIAYIPPTPAPFAFFKLPAMRWALPTAAAAILTTTALILALHHTPQPAPTTIARNTPPPLTAAPSSAVPPSTAVPPISSVPTEFFVLPTRANASSFAAPGLPQTIPSNSSQAEPTPTLSHTQLASVPSATISEFHSAVATNQQPNSTAPPASNAPTNPQPSTRSHHNRTTDITLAVLGNLTPDRSFTSTTGTVNAAYTQETTPSVGALASFHQQLRPWLGYRITASYSEPTFQYAYQAGAEGSEGNIVRQHAYELSGTYVVQGPHHRRFSTAAEAGIGLLALLPADSDLTTIPVGNTFHPEGVFGVSAEYALSKHLAIHAGYRALLYKAPEAYPAYGAVVPPAPNNFTLSNEPVIGLTYRFRPTREE